MNKDADHGKESQTITPENKAMSVKDDEAIDKTTISLDNSFKNNKKPITDSQNQNYQHQYASTFQFEIERSEFIGSFGNKIEQRYIALMTYINSLLKLYRTSLDWRNNYTQNEVDEHTEFIIKVRNEFFRLKGGYDRDRQSSQNRVIFTKNEDETLVESMMSIEWAYSQKIWNILTQAIQYIEKECISFKECIKMIQSDTIRNVLSSSSKNNLTTIEKTFTPFSYDITFKLHSFYTNNQYPNRMEKRSLANETGLTLSQVNSWFSNKRTRQRKAANKRHLSLSHSASHAK